MGLILSAMAAAGDAGVQSMNQNIQQQNAMDLEQQRADLAEQKAKTLAEFNNKLAVDTANQQRTAEVARVNAAKDGIIDKQIATKYAPSDAAVADAAAGRTDAPLTTDQQAVIDQSKANYRDALLTDPATILKAASQTGDLKSKELISIMLDQHRQDAAAAAEARRAAYDQGRLENDARRNDIRDRAVDAQFAKVDALFAKIDKSGSADKKPAEVVATEWLMANKDDPEAMAAWDRQHTNKSKDIVTLAADILTKDPNAGSKKAMTTEAAYDAARKLYDLGGKTSLTDTSKPITVPNPVLNSLPPGAKQVSTSGGKPVYATPDGRMFTTQ